MEDGAALQSAKHAATETHLNTNLDIFYEQCTRGYFIKFLINVNYLKNEPLEDGRIYGVYKNSGRTSQRTQTVFIIKVNQ